MSIKILATLGPSSLNEQVIKEIERESIYVFRINMSHTALKELEPAIRKIQKHTDVPICIDSEGAQIRNHKVKGGHVTLHEKDVIKIHHEEILGDSNNISFHPGYISREMLVGDIIDIDFCMARIRVIETNKDYCLAEVLVKGTIGNNKAANIINRKIKINALTDKDISAIPIAADMGIRHYALSFANFSEDVDTLRALVPEGSTIISKIESINGLLNLRGILEKTDEILIDRGDLSREVDLRKIPFLQRRIISFARAMEVPVYVATNLLESMIETPTPTRAEINDVVSTLLMGANGLVLAAETAVGKHPAQAVKMIRDLVREFNKWTPNTTINELLQID